MYLYYKKNYPITPCCLTESEISKEYYNAKQKMNEKYSRIPSDIKRLRKEKDVLKGYEIVNCSEMYISI